MGHGFHSKLINYHRVYGYKPTNSPIKSQHYVLVKLPSFIPSFPMVFSKDLPFPIHGFTHPTAPSGSSPRNPRLSRAYSAACLVATGV